jgi:hypothetical protein
MTAHRNVWRLGSAAATALLVASCTSATSKKTNQPNPIENPTGTITSPLPGSSGTPSPASTGTYPTSGPCTSLCARGDDGMQYRVTAARRFPGPSGLSIVAIGFSIINPTGTGHDFDATGGGFSAVLASGGVVQLENELSATGAGNPSCYSNPVMYPGSNDPNRVHVDPNTTFAFPKQICMRVDPSDKITEIEFADQDASAKRRRQPADAHLRNNTEVGALERTGTSRIGHLGSIAHSTYHDGPRTTVCTFRTGHRPGRIEQRITT